MLFPVSTQQFSWVPLIIQSRFNQPLDFTLPSKYDLTWDTNLQPKPRLYSRTSHDIHYSVFYLNKPVHTPTETVHKMPQEKLKT